MKDRRDDIISGQTTIPFPTRKGFFCSDRFSPESFLRPPLSCAPVYSWLWNDKITEEETEKQLQEMAKLGIKRFYILPLPRSFRPRRQPSRLEPDYLTDEYFRLYRHTLLKAKGMGMEAWLYNEGGWPSGGACGKVTASDPSLIRKTIKKRSFILPKGRPYTPKEDVEAAFYGAKRIRNGQILPEKTKLTEYYLAPTVEKNSADFPDLTLEESAEAFFSSTHEKYAKHIGDLFGDVVTALFTDEPTAPRPFPFRKALAEEFSDSFSIEITDYFPFLFGDRPLTEEAEDAIVKWYSFIAKKLGENYFDKERKWSGDHGLTYLGHLDKDDEVRGSLSGGSFDLIGTLSRLDVPGVDVIYRQIFPPKIPLPTDANGFFPRLASSAAAQQGNRHALTESFAVYGNGLTCDEMRYVLNFQAMRGINVYNLMLFSYGRTGFLRAGELPHFAASHACYKDLAVFNGYLERLSYLFCLGKRKVPVALYFPQSDSYVGNKTAENSYINSGKLLENSKIPFDIISDCAFDKVDKTELKNGVLAVGAARYTSVVLPGIKRLFPETEKVLRAFLLGGGNVYFSGAQNDIGLAGAKPLQELLCHPTAVFEGDSRGLTVETSVLSDGEMLFIMNETADKKDFVLRVPDRKFYYIDVTAAKIHLPTAICGLFTGTLASGELCALYFTEKSLPATAAPVENGVWELTEWSLKKTESFRLEKDAFINKTVRKKARKTKLGDWRKRMGFAFSGSGEYSTSFTLDSIPEKARLDLGDVRYSCEVFLNGSALGVRVMPPYVYDLPTNLLRKENALTVRLTNTVANRFRYTTAFLKYPKYKLTHYHDRQKKYLATSLSGGLFGPVKIRYE